jgi:hypothetical protein
MTTVNGFVHIRCVNCNKTDWILKSKFINISSIKNYMFCEVGCEVSYVLRNSYIKVNKINNTEDNNKENNEIIITGTISSLCSVYK